MSNVHTLFDQKKGDPIITGCINFLTDKCAHWLDKQSYDSFHSDEALKTLLNIRKIFINSEELKVAYINFTRRFKEDSAVEYTRLLDSIQEVEDARNKINALTCPTDKWSNFTTEGKSRPQILNAIVAMRVLLEQRHFTLKDDVWRLYSLIVNEHNKEEYVSVQIDSVIREWRNWIYEHRGTMYPLEALKDAFHQIAKVNEFHSLQKKICSITWDGIDRHAAAAKAMGLDESQFTTRAFRHHLIASMARLFYPGVWYDLVLCVFGDQGAGKTTGLRLLYVRDNVISCNFFELDPKQKSEATRHGIWAVENPDTFGDARKADFNRIKADVSIDSFVGRDAYGRVEDIRRVNITYVVWYTGNEVHVLRDPTGNRRFIIVYSVGPTDEDWLRRHSDQLWAQVYIEMEQLRSKYLEEMNVKGISEEYPKYLELPRELWEESTKRSSIFVLTRDVLKYLHEKCPRNTSISDQALSRAMIKVVILAKEKCEGPREDIKWTPKQISIKGANSRGYRIDFEGESKQRAFELIAEMAANSNKSPEGDFIKNSDSIIGKHGPF